MNASVLLYSMIEMASNLVGEGGLLLAAQAISPVRFLALVFLLLTLVGLFTLLIMSFILWGIGVELPGLSHLLKRVSGRRPTGPWITDVFGGATPLALVMGGWMALWVLLAVALWASTQAQAKAIAARPTPAAPATQATPTPAASPAQPTPTQPPAAAVPPPSQDVEEILINQGCGGCHTLKGISGMTGTVGPELTRIGAVAAERIKDPNYTGSATTPAEYIRESIVDPRAYVVEGFQPVMPTDFSNRIPPEQLDALVEYLTSLE